MIMDSSFSIGIIGAGTMGSGIAQVAAQAGHSTFLYDSRQEAVDKAMAGLGKTFANLVAKGKLNRDMADATLARIKPATDLKELSGCGLVVEAIIEDLGIKKKLFAELESLLPQNAVLASNTSSLSITAIAAACARPERVIGLHFFNPAPLMPLVEVVPALQSASGLAADCTELMRAWGKTPVTCKDTPGFIVNRVARPFYGEAIRIFEEGIADMATIDRAMKSVGGFRMGPFELMDLIGNDINFTVTKTVWESFFFDPRYRPSITQQRQVEAGWLGRKSGRGYFDHRPENQPATAQVPNDDPALARAIVDRILVMLINEAVDALHCGLATREDIDLAMTKGVNYPKGLLQWCEELGARVVLERLEGLQHHFGEDRYRPSPLLRAWAGA